MTSELIALTLAGVGVLGLFCQWVAWQFKLPAILFLLIAGLLVGPIFGVFSPQDALGDLFFPFISLAVAVILFEGSLTLNFKQIQGISKSVWSIVTIGAVISWVITSLATHHLLGLDWTIAFLFGSLTVVTGPTVIVPLLRTVRPNSKLANILRWEGILIDPLGALFVVMVYEFIVSHSQMHSLTVFGIIIVIGFSLGIAAGALVAAMIRRNWLPEYLQPFAVLTLLLGVFAASNYLEHESGLLTVTVMGIWLANAKEVNISHILHFKENLTILFISGLFILLAARVELADFEQLGFAAIVLFAVIQLVSRPVSIFLSTWRSNLEVKEKAFLAWVAPRGIVAAAVSSLFAIKLMELNVEGANLLVPLIFMVIIGTVVLQSATARPVAGFLGVAEPAPRGFLLVGANDVARAVGKAIQTYDCRVLMSDTNWDYVSKARMGGFEGYYGNPTSSHADEYLDLIGIGQVLALTPDQHLNSVASVHFSNEFGHRKVFSLQDRKTQESLDKHSHNEEHAYSLLLGGNASYKKLASLLSQGAEIKHTKISDSFSFDDYQAQYKDAIVVPLFIVDSKKRIHVITQPDNVKPASGEVMVSLIKEHVVKEHIVNE
ncbi:cation:proton antiporter [Vibrio methylphosphonaticus]|uniref:cation:proton antiporter n=1 Tax=Vibrio methylphosphonaticus TaxID=2946866 RepID=UPI00202A9F19|nr:sodium:proton antiporter [Vibrio methylphosphonaticus]MCL9773760.1 sodium:proton antiporter [Vibrio methylphosphonaticus]